MEGRGLLQPREDWVAGHHTLFSIHCIKSNNPPVNAVQLCIKQLFVSEILTTIRCPQPQSGDAPSGECLRGRGRYGVICR